MFKGILGAIHRLEDAIAYRFKLMATRAEQTAADMVPADGAELDKYVEVLEQRSETILLQLGAAWRARRGRRVTGGRWEPARENPRGVCDIWCVKCGAFKADANRSGVCYLCE